MKKALSKTEIEKLAKLSSLSLSENELIKIGEQFGETIEFVENLRDLDTSEVSGLTNVSQQNNVFFEDGEENNRLLSLDDIHQNAKNIKNNSFVVPKILEK